MHKLLALASTLLLAATLTGCQLSSSTNLSEVARAAQLSNVTTGDGTFENYKATGHYKATEVGIGVGLPFIGKFFELFPAATNEELLTDAATAAKGDGATAMINVTPAAECYYGIPFIIVGIYVDHADGTGIAVK